jgi:TP901 family phage tail tape measure protein
VAVSNVELRVGATQAITALKNVNTQAQKFNQTVNGTNSKLKDANKALPMLSKGFFGSGAAAKGAAVSFRTAGAALMTALAPIAKFVTIAAALGKIFTDLQAQDFATARVRTLGVDVDALTPKLATLSNELSGQASQLELLESSYDLASAGFAETAEITEILKAAQLGATGGFSDLQTVTDATTSVLNAYGLEADKAGKIVDGFAQTQADGKIVVDQYAKQIGRIAPIAAGAGVGIDELNAAISAVTATGVPVESTFAGLRQVIASIQKPTKQASEVAEKLGIDFSAAAIKSKGLSGVLEEIVAKGGASADNLSQLFGSVEALTAIQPLLNDELVKFNEALENQANAQGRAAKDAFTAANTISGQLKRIGAAFTNLTTDGSEFGIIIRDTLKVAAVTVEALGVAFKFVGDIVRGVVGVVSEIGKVFTQNIGIDAVGTLMSLEQGWINVKEQVTKFGDEIIFVGRVIGGVIGQALKISFNSVREFFSNFNDGLNILKAQFVQITDGIKQRFADLVAPIVKVFQNIVDAIPEPIKKLLGGAAKFAIPTIDFSTGKLQNPFKNLQNPFKNLGKDLDFLKEGLIEFSGIEREITDEVNKQVDAKNKIVEATGLIKTKVDELTPAEKQAREEAEKLKETFKGIGESVRSDLVGGLREAINGSKTFGQAISGVLNNLKNKLLDIALNKAISGIGKALGGGGGGGLFGSFLGGLFGKERGGRVSAGGAFVVGERGPEILQMGSKGGNIIPNSQIGGGGDSVVNNISISVDASGSSVSGSSADGNQLGQQLAGAIQAELIKQKRAGGLLA